VRLLKGIDLISAYTSFFSGAYDNFKAELQRSVDAIVRPFAEGGLLSVQNVVAGNAALIEYRWQYIQAGLPGLDFDDIREKWAFLEAQHARFTLPSSVFVVFSCDTDTRACENITNPRSSLTSLH
jgi:hypothetical protein